MQLSEALDRFLGSLHGEKSPRTVVWYRDKLKPLWRDLGERDVRTISIDDLREWRLNLLQRTERYSEHPTIPTRPGGLSPTTINDHIRAARRFFKWLIEEGLFEHNPARRLGYVREDHREPKAISLQDLERIVAAAKPSSARNYALVRFLASTGCHLGGLVSLTSDRLDIEDRCAVVIEKFRGGNRACIVYVDAETDQSLRHWLKVRPTSQTAHVFLSHKGTSLTPGGVYQALKRLAKRAGIKGRFNPHSFRHAFALLMPRKGASLNMESQLMGLRDVSITSRYYGQ